MLTNVSVARFDKEPLLRKKRFCANVQHAISAKTTIINVRARA